MATRTEPVAPKNEIHYPESDGEPMGETDLHVQALMAIYQALLHHFRNEPDVYVSGNSFWYWEEGNPKSRRAPDGMVVKGVEKKPRRSFFSWREGGAVPAVIFEISSEDTWREDLDAKRKQYERLGVKEYFLFDPDDKYLRPQLQGFRLSSRARYQRLKLDAHNRLRSEELGLWLIPEEYMVRFIDIATNQLLPTLGELSERAEQERQRAEQERQRAEQERQRAEQERQRAVQERQHGEQERERAEQERQRADALEAELARLQAQLKEQKRNGH